MMAEMVAVMTPASLEKALLRRRRDMRKSDSRTPRAGEQFLLQDCTAKARARGMLLLTDTGSNSNNETNG